MSTNMGFLRRVERWNIDIDQYVNRIVPPSPLHRLPEAVSRFLGYRKKQKEDVGNVLGAFWSLVGAFCGLAVIAAVFNNTESVQRHYPPALIASFVRQSVSYDIYSKLTVVSRVPLLFWNTTRSARRSANRAMLCSVTPSRPLSVSASQNSFYIIQSLRRSSG